MFSLLKELIRFGRAYKKPWMVPLILLLLAAGSFVVVAQTSALGPFIYALF